jgi:hypothetical protein
MTEEEGAEFDRLYPSTPGPFCRECGRPLTDEPGDYCRDHVPAPKLSEGDLFDGNHGPDPFPAPPAEFTSGGEVADEEDN